MTEPAAVHADLSLQPLRCSSTLSVTPLARKLIFHRLPTTGDSCHYLKGSAAQHYHLKLPLELCLTLLVHFNQGNRIRQDDALAPALRGESPGHNPGTIDVGPSLRSLAAVKLPPMVEGVQHERAVWKH